MGFNSSLPQLVWEKGFVIVVVSLCSLGAFLVHHDKLMSFENEICLLLSITLSMLKK